MRLSFKVEKPSGAELIAMFETADGALYEGHYRYEYRVGAWWAVLSHVIEQLPPVPPQLQGYGDTVRFPILGENGRIDWAKEAAQRRKEWADANREVMAVG